MERTITNLGKKVSSTYKSWRYRNNALGDELEVVRKQIDLQKSAYSSYMGKAESIGLSEEYKELIRNGGLSIQDIADDTLKEQINDYQNYYKKALDCADAVQDLRDKLADLAKTKFDLLTTRYEARLQDIEHVVNMINGQIDGIEGRNQIAGTSFYEALMEQENKNIEQLTAEYNDKVAVFKDAIESKTITVGSEMWQEMKSNIDDVSESLQEANNQLEEYGRKLKEVSKLKFDSLNTQYSDVIGLVDTRISQVESTISLIENAGYIASTKYYDTLIEAQTANTDALFKKYTALSDSLTEAMQNGVQKYDSEWYEMVSDINDVESALIDANSALIEYSNSLRQIQWDLFDRIQESISGITDESNFLVDLLSANTDLYDDYGNMNNTGLAVQGLHVVSYQTYIEQTKEYAKELESLNQQIAENPKNTKLIDRYNELLKLQRQSILNTKDEESALKDLVSNGYDKMLSAMKDIISARKDALSQEKEMYDYQKEVLNQTETINALKKQLIAYKDDNSEETKAIRQRLEVELEKAESALDETEYDKYISDQEAMLDDFYSELESWVNTRLDDISRIINEAVIATNENAKIIKDELVSELSGENGTLTNQMNSIWDNISKEWGNEGSVTKAVTESINAIKENTNNLPTDISGIKTPLDEINTSLSTTIPDVLSRIETALNDMKGVLNQIIAPVEEYTDIVENNYDEDDDDDDWTPEPVTTTANTTVSENKTPTGTQKSTTSTYKYEVKAPGSAAETFSVTASSKTEADKKVKEYVDSLNEDDEDAGYDWKRKYARGVHKLKNDEIAWTQENGEEVILSPARNAILTPLKHGDTVLTADQTDNIYELSKLTPENIESIKEMSKNMANRMIPNVFPVTLPEISRESVANNVTNDINMSITLPNVKNYDEFVSQMQTDKRFERIIQSMTLGNALGRNNYNKLKF